MIIILLNACGGTKDTSKETSNTNHIKQQVPFESSKWKIKKEDEYPHRLNMYKEVLYSDSVRTLLKPQVISMLGKPDREENNHLYYLIEANTIGSFTLNQKSLVIKFKSNDEVEWIKLYGED
ncbi:hypothetical protein [Ekhidna lutea]|uniref:hypothetical protein n=1 Tax=Ekhidna lutea TaxID=447679 RepID=UPI00117CD81B|nr:hypothetical protein [Ekhidna lutea]